MADKRYNEYLLGNPGRLEYYPPEVRKAEDQGWLTARIHEKKAIKSTQLSSHHFWFNSSHQEIQPDAQRSKWHENQKQKRWLLKTHPEAALVNEEELEDILISETPASQPSPGSSWRFTQFAIGEMADISNGQQSLGVPLLAMAAGSAGDILRFTRPAATHWYANDSDDPVIPLLEHEKHQETLWTKDLGVIHGIKAIVSTKRFEPVRWLAVQRDFGTSIFRPEYRKVPVVSETFSGTGPQAPSHIAPNLLFTISKTRTGCDAHCDVAFNPGIKSKPAQLAIIDQGGNWTIWDVTGTRNRVYKRPKIRLDKCGSIHGGVTARPNLKPTTDSGWHRIFWVGSSELDSFGDEEYDDEMEEDEEHKPVARATSMFPPLQRASILLLCNQRLLRLFDLETNEFMPDVHLFLPSSRDSIVDVEVDTVDRRYIYIVTTSRVFVVAILELDNAGQRRTTRKASVLESFPHFKNKLEQNLKVTITPGPSSSLFSRSTLVILYAQYSDWHDVFCVKFSRKTPGRVISDHHYLNSLDRWHEHTGNGLQTLCSYQAFLSPQQQFSSKACANVDTCFFQLFSFAKDLSLSCCLGVSSTAGMTSYPLSLRKASEDEHEEMNRKHKGKMVKFSRQDIERRGAIRYLSTRFVLADSVSEFRYGKESAGTNRRLVTDARPAKSACRMVAPVYSAFQTMLTELWEEGAPSPTTAGVYVAAPFDPVFVVLQEALETQTLPRNAMFDLITHVRVPEDFRESSKEWQAEVEQLSHVDPALRIVALDRPQGVFKDSRSLEELVSKLGNLTLAIEDLNDNHDGDKEFEFLMLCRIACELFFARNGMAYMPVESAQSQVDSSTDLRSSPPLMSEDLLMDGQDSVRMTTASSSTAVDSQMSSRASTPVSTTTSIATDVPSTYAAETQGLKLIKALTGSGKVSAASKIKLPAPWNVGEEASATIFSVSNNNEVTEGMRRRAKQEAREARKRKRAETLLQLQKEHNLLPATQPVFKSPFSTQVSQPMNNFFSSQSRPMSSAPPIAMSQPVAGAFGRRSELDRPKKKPKRKGGF